MSSRLPVKKNRRFSDFLAPAVPLARGGGVTDAGKSAGRGSENKVD